jgi:hypothetical protein
MTSLFRLGSNAINPGRIRGNFLFRPIAVALALLLILPPASWVTNSRVARASAQVVSIQPPQCGPTILVVQNRACGQNLFFNADLSQLESDTVQTYLKLHGLQASDAAMIYSYGRSDLRSELRGMMLASLISILSRAPGGNAGNYGSLSAHEIAIYQWFRQKVLQNETALYQSAIADRNAYLNNFCTWKPDPDIAAAYGLTYDVTHNCDNTVSIGGKGDPPVPSVSYFLGAAYKNSYGLAVNVPGGSDIVRQTMINAAASTVALGSVVALGVFFAGVLGISFTTAFITTTTISMGVVVTTISGAAAGAGAIAGTILLPLMMAAVGVVMVIEIVNHDNDVAALSVLEALQAAATSTVDLTGMLSDPLGIMKIVAAFTPVTLPEYYNTNPLPTHQTFDPTFFVNDDASYFATVSSFSYQDWSHVVWNVTTHGGWFVQTSTQNGQEVDSITATIYVLDATGHPYTVGRMGNTSNVVITDAKPATNAVICLADATTGVSAQTGAGCISWVGLSFPYTDGSNHGFRAQVIPSPAPPSITSGTTANFLAFQPGTQHFTITATNNAAITLTSPLTIPGLQFTTGNGSADLSYTAPATPLVTTITVGVQAQALNGLATQTLTIVNSGALHFVSANSATFFDGGTVIPFAVLAAGAGNITLAAHGFPAGMTFTDNGNGSGTLGGIINTGATGCAPPGCYFEAQANIGGAITTLDQAFTVKVVPNPQATYSGPTSTTFNAGLPNSFVLVGNQEVSVSYLAAPSWSATGLPAWLTLTNLGLNAVLSGAPPQIGGSFPTSLTLATNGFTSTPFTFTINVDVAPQFTSPNWLNCQAPTSGVSSCSMTITTNQNAGTTITEVGALPPGVTLTDLHNGTATLQGNIAKGSGGYYPLALSVASVNGSAAQPFSLRVYEGAAFTSPASVDFTVGVSNTFTITTSGFPKSPEGSVAGALNGPGMSVTGGTAGVAPAWLNFVQLGSGGSVVLSGTPPPGSPTGPITLYLTANNQIGSAATQTLILDVITPTAMTIQAKLVAGDSVGTSRQGTSVAISSDGNTAIVGGAGDNGEIGSGFAFSRSGTTWSEAGSKLVYGSDAAGGQGTAVAVQANGAMAIVGAPGDLNGLGKANVFMNQGAAGFAYRPQPLSFIGNAGNPAFGASAAISDDGTTALVGGPANHSNAGAVWAFLISPFAISQQGNPLFPSDAAGAALFGYSLAISPDGSTAFIGGPGDNGGAGAVWVFTQSGGVWSQFGSKLTGSGAVGNARFGTSVAVSAEQTLVVGGPADNNGNGAVWFFSFGGGQWFQQYGKVTPSDAVGAPAIGTSVAITGDGSLALAGGPSDNLGGDGIPVGAAWFFSRNNSVWSQNGGKIVSSDTLGSAQQGASVALSRDGYTALTGGVKDNPIAGGNGGVGAVWAFATPDPTIAITRAGPLVAGLPGSYTVTVSNVGAGPTSGVTTWSVALPSNLAVTSLTGPFGWTCIAATPGCTTNGPLPAGASAQFTMAVNATVAGLIFTVVAVNGVELNTLNDTAYDSTTIAKGTPVVTWPPPAPMTFGGSLGSSQLNAIANVPGSFVYTPAAGVVPPVGNGETLSVTFTPTDLSSFFPVTTHQTINVLATGGDPAKLVLTQTLARGAGNAVVVTLTTVNSGATAAQNVVLTAAKIGTVSGTPIPLTIGTIAAGGTVQSTITFPATVGSAGAPATLTVTGTYTGGTISSGGRIVLP